MQVFKVFFKIAQKHMTQVCIYIGVFLVIIMMMSLSIQDSQTESFSAKAVDIVIIDNDHTELSQGITKYIGCKHNIIDLEDTSNESLTDNLFYQTISYVLTIPENFEEAFLNNDSSNKLSHNMRADSAAGFFVNHQVDGFLDSVELYLIGGFTMDQAIEKSIDKLNEDNTVESISFDKTAQTSNEIMFYFYQYLAYVMLMILSVSLVPILATFHQTDINARISCSSTTSKSRNIQIGIACLTYSFLTWLLFELLALIAFKPENVFSEQGLLCMLNGVVFTLISTSITLLLSTFNFSDNSLNLIANIIGLGMSFLCGIFVPQWFLSSKVLSVSKFLPAYWYIKIVNMVSGRSGEAYSLSNYWKYLGIEIIFLAAIFSIYLVLNKSRKKTSLA